MMFDNLLDDRDGAAVSIAINRPSALNALNASTLDEVGRLVSHVRPGADGRSVVLIGAGE